MFQAIKATPTLSGKDAKRFVEIISNTKKFVPKLNLDKNGIEKAIKQILEREQKLN